MPAPDPAAGASQPAAAPTSLTNSDVTVTPVASPADRKRFIDVARTVFAGDPAWIAPLDVERAEHVDPAKNPALAALDHQLWIASRGGRPVGRISAQINPVAQERYGAGVGHFGFFDAIDDAAVAAALFETAETWLRARGAAQAVGPFNFTINEECGVLIDGFDHAPVLMMPHARAYYADHLERAGYAKAKDLIAYQFDLANAAVPPRLKRLVDRIGSDPSVRLRPLDTKNLDQDVAAVMDIFNDAWSANWGFLPFTQAEIAHAAKAMRPVLRSKWACIAELEGEPVAFALTLPNVNEAAADLGGRLLPFGWAKLLYRLKLKGVASARMPLMGVRKSLQGTTIGAALSFAVIDRAHEGVRADGVKTAELSWILDDNASMRRMIEEIGGVPYKTYRMYAKALA